MAVVDEDIALKCTWRHAGKVDEAGGIADINGLVRIRILSLGLGLDLHFAFCSLGFSFTKYIHAASVSMC